MKRLSYVFWAEVKVVSTAIVTAIMTGIVIVIATDAHANVVGNGLQNFNTTPDGLDFVTVQSSQTLKPGIFNLGFFVNDAVNSLPYFDSAVQGRTNFNDTLLESEFNMAVGLVPDLEAGISVPFLLQETVNADQPFHGQFLNEGNTEVRGMMKWRLTGDEKGGFALVGSANFNRTQDNPYFGQNGGPIYNLEGAVSGKIKRWNLGLNLGYRWPTSGDPIPNSPIEPLHNQIIGSAAASYLLSSVDTKLIFEIFGSQPAESVSANANRQSSSLEFLGGVKHDVNQNLSLHAGAGTEVMHGVSSPDWRVYAGVNYAFGPVFGKRGPAAEITEERFTLKNIEFEFDSDKMTEDSLVVVKTVAINLKGIVFKKILIVGYTDSIGSSAYNRALSLKRANAIKNVLVTDEGFSPTQIETQGAGPDDPVADNGNFQGRQENRRVEIVIIK